MPIAFSRSLRSLQADGRSRRAIWFLLIPSFVIAAWIAWFLDARVSRFEVSDDAFVEVPGGVQELQAPVSGRVIKSGLAERREVMPGDLVLEIDASPPRRVEANMSGKLSQVASLGPGGNVTAGDKLCAITPFRETRVIANFASPNALGRVRAGQHANIRLRSLGSFASRVTRVNDAHVELAFDRSASPSRLPNLMPAIVEVEVESVSPATLLLRAASFHGQKP